MQFTTARSRWKIGLSAALLLAASVVIAQDKAVSGVSFSPEAIRAQITYLASDELRGRGSGTPGNEMAARFIAQEFAKYGLKPLGTSSQRDPNAPMDGSGYFQPFRFVAGRAVGKGNLLEATFGGKTQKYRADHDFEPSSVSGAGEAEGPVVFVGYGIRAPQEKHDDYAGMDVKGKVVLLMASAPFALPTELANITRKARDARDLGASAVLVILPTDSDLHGPAPSSLTDVSDEGLPVLRLKHTVVEAWFKGAGKDLADLETKAKANQAVSTPLDASIRLAADVTKVEEVSANVVGMIEGSDPTLKNEYVIIGAHLDHLGMGGIGSLQKPGSPPAIHHGADDNASGTAGVMQLAQRFGFQVSGARDQGKTVANTGNSVPETRHLTPLTRPKRSLILICFSGEELGLLGSDHYVKNPLVPLEKTVAMLNMDMVGRLRDNKLIVIGSGTAKEWDDLLNTVNRTAGFNLARSESGFGASDQQSFYVKNIPVLFFFTDNHPDYHRPTDTADKINAPGEAKVLQLVADCVQRIADSPARPTFQKIAVANANTPSRGFRVYFGSVPDYAAQVEGVRLNGVREGSPADKAGLKEGDIIIKFGDKSIKGIQDYALALNDYKPGDKVNVVIKRGDQTLTLSVTLAERKE